MARGLVLVALTATSMALVGCSGPSAAETAAEELPDLSAEGFTSLECGEGEVFDADFAAPEGAYVAQCWSGTSDQPFTALADEINFDVRDAMGTQDITAHVCPDDVLVAVGGIACRASYEDDVVVRVVVALTDPASVVEGLGEEPTQEDVDAATTGATVEILVQTEPLPEE